MDCGQHGLNMRSSQIRQVLLSTKIEYARITTKVFEQDNRRADGIETDGNSQAINHGAF
jgi:hypothetical protein